MNSDLLLTQILSVANPQLSSLTTPDGQQSLANKSTVKTLYIHRIGDRCLTHDGYIQIGIHSHSLERHIELNPTINWVETNWCPDIFKNRYKRATFQAHERVSGGKDAIECRPRDFPDGSGCDTIQEETRLERTV